MTKLAQLLTGILIILVSACGPKPWHEPPLHDAAQRGNLEKVQDLVKSGVDVNKVNNQGATPLHWAAFKGHVEVARYLVAQGANINAHTKKGSTPLRLATTHKQQAMIDFLIAQGAQ